MPRTRKDRPASLRRENWRHFFFLNPYVDCAFTRCPKCEGFTRIRKFCLMILVEPCHFISLNKTCRYCPGCELIIAKKSEMDRIVHGACAELYPDAIQGKYTVFGTMARTAWKAGVIERHPAKEGVEHTTPFKGVLNFETRRPQWVKVAD